MESSFRWLGNFCSTETNIKHHLVLYHSDKLKILKQSHEDTSREERVNALAQEIAGAYQKSQGKSLKVWIFDLFSSFLSLFPFGDSVEKKTHNVIMKLLHLDDSQLSQKLKKIEKTETEKVKERFFQVMRIPQSCCFVNSDFVCILRKCKTLKEIRDIITERCMSLNLLPLPLPEQQQVAAIWVYRDLHSGPSGALVKLPQEEHENLWEPGEVDGEESITSIKIPQNLQLTEEEQAPKIQNEFSKYVDAKKLKYGRAFVKEFLPYLKEHIAKYPGAQQGTEPLQLNWLHEQLADAKTLIEFHSVIRKNFPTSPKELFDTRDTDEITFRKRVLQLYLAMHGTDKLNETKKYDIDNPTDSNLQYISPENKIKESFFAIMNISEKCNFVDFVFVNKLMACKTLGEMRNAIVQRCNELGLPVPSLEQQQIAAIYVYRDLHFDSSGVSEKLSVDNGGGDLNRADEDYWLISMQHLQNSYDHLQKSNLTELKKHETPLATLDALKRMYIKEQKEFPEDVYSVALALFVYYSEQEMATTPGVSDIMKNKIEKDKGTLRDFCTDNPLNEKLSSKEKNRLLFLPSAEAIRIFFKDKDIDISITAIQNFFQAVHEDFDQDAPVVFHVSSGKDSPISSNGDSDASSNS